MEDPTDELQETLAKVVDPVSVLKLTLEPVVPAPVVLNTSVLSPGGMAPLSLVLVGQVLSPTQYLNFRGKTILADIQSSTNWKKIVHFRFFQRLLRLISR